MNLLDKLSVIPDPWNRPFLIVWNVTAVAVAAVLCWNSGATTLWPAGLVLIASLLAVFLAVPGRRVQNAGSGDPPSATGTLSDQRPVLARKSWIHPVVAPLLLAAPFMLTAIFIGNPGCGGFPAVLVALLGAVAFTMRTLEHRLRADSAEDDPAAQHYFGRTLAWVSTMLFFFGVVTLWPWLGKLYGDRYFWILVVGVLAPQLYFWGRLRQPHSEHPMNALIRFNRLLPYIGIILLVAIVLG